MATHASHAGLPFPVRNARYSVWVGSLDADGDPTDLTSPDSERSLDGAAFIDCAEEATVITGGNGSALLTLTGEEMNCSVLALAVKGTGPKTTIASLNPRVLPILESGTATAGAAGSITLAVGAAAYSLVGCIIRTTGGTGGGGTGGANNQARVITAYNPTTKVATVAPDWEVAAAAGTTYDILLTDAGSNALWAGGSVLALKQLNIVNDSGSALVASSTGSNGAGIAATGHGTNAGLAATGGATGPGLQAAAGATGPNNGIHATGTGTGHGFSAVGSTTGNGIRAKGGATGHGLFAQGGATSGNGAEFSAVAGNSAGLAAAGNGTGAGLAATGGATGHGGAFAGAGIGSGLVATGGVGAGADGARFVAGAGSNGDGFEMVKDGAGIAMNPAATGATAAEVADAVWAEPLSTYTTEGTAGKELQDASAGGGGGLTAPQVSAAVWDAARASYNAANSFGESVRVNAAGLATDAVTEIQTGLATAAAQTIGQADLDNIQTRLPAALVSGRMDSSVGAMAANVVTAAAIATDAIDNDALAGSAVTEIDTALTAAHGAGSWGGSGGATAGEIADAVWDEVLSPAHTGAGSAGAALIGAGSAGDPWVTPLPGAYGAGTAGKLLADTGAAVDTEVAAIKAKTDNLPASPAAVGSPMTLAAGAVNAAAIATDAIDNDAIAPSAVTEIQAGLATAATPMTLSAAERNAIADAHFARPLPATPTVDTAGEALQAARAQGFGRWGIVGNVLTLYKSDNVTPLKAFTLSPAGGPFLARAPQ